MCSRMIKVFPVLCLLLSGCFASNAEYLLYSPRGKVADDVYDQGVRDHIKSLSAGPVVSGRDCESAILGLIPLPPSFHIIPSEEKAFAAAMKNSGPPYNALANAKVELTQYLVPPPLLRVICFDISGVAVESKPYFQKERVSDRRKVP